MGIEFVTDQVVPNKGSTWKYARVAHFEAWDISSARCLVHCYKDKATYDEAQAIGLENQAIVYEYRYTVPLTTLAASTLRWWYMVESALIADSSTPFFGGTITVTSLIYP